jgi:ABC-type sugar transport system substrate-binding protein
MTDNPDETHNQREGADPPKGRLTRRQLLSRSALAGGSALAASVLGGSVFRATEAQAAAPAGSAGPYPGDEAWRKAVADKVAGRTITIGFTPPAASEFYDEVEHGAFSQMRTYGDWFGVKWKWTTFFPGEHQDINDQVNTIQNWATSKFDAVLVCTAGDFASMQKVYQSAADKGTRVFQFNMPAEMWPQEENKAISTISYNNAMQSGYIATEYIAQQLGGKGKLLLIWGLPGHWATSRLNGVNAALKKYPNLKIVGQQRGDYVRDKGLDAAQNLLQRDQDINAIYGENEEMALGASQAMGAMGLQPWDGKKGIIVIGADGLKSGYEAIKQGQLTATVNVGPVEQGRQSVQAIFWNLVFGYVPAKVIDVRTMVVDKTNVEEPLAYVNWALGVPKIG